MDNKAVLYGIGGLITGILLTLLVGGIGMRSSMGRMMMRNMCGRRGAVEVTEPQSVASAPAAFMPESGSPVQEWVNES